MTKNPKLTDPEEMPEPRLALVREAKGRSMFESLLELRVLLPYLSHLAPLLERTSKGTSELTEISRGMAVIQSGSRELETLTRNQTLQLERVEDKIVSLEKAYQDTLEESRSFFSEMRSFRRWVIRVTLTTAVLVGASAGMIAYLVMRS